MVGFKEGPPGRRSLGMRLDKEVRYPQIGLEITTVNGSLHSTYTKLSVTDCSE